MAACPSCNKFAALEFQDPEVESLEIDGTVVARGPEATNPKMATGTIEVGADKVTVLSTAAELPLPVAGEQEYPEDIRLKYRFLDLRREKLHQNIMVSPAMAAAAAIAGHFVDIRDWR